MAVSVLVLSWTASAGAAPERTDLALSGERLTMWAEPDGTRLLIYKGNFTAKSSTHTLTSRQAVIWLTQTRLDGQVHSQLRLYLDGAVRVTESNGVVTEDQELLTALDVIGQLTVRAIQRTDEPQRDDPLYQQAIEALKKSSQSEPIQPEPPAEQPRQQPLPPPEEQEELPPETTDLEEAPPPRRPDVVQSGPLSIPTGPIFMRGSLATRKEGDVLIYVLTADERGQLYVSQAALKSRLMIQMRADAAVIFQNVQSLQQQDGESASAQQVGQSFIGIYLEGHVLLSQGDRTIRAQRIYYDFRNQRALILDGTLRTVERQRRIPIYLRAKEIRQLSQREFVARKATITSSDFYRPEYHVGAGKILLEDTTPRDDYGQPTGKQRLRFQADNTTFNIEGLPFFWWPRITGDLKRGETALHTIRGGYSGSDGVTMETDWWLFRLLGLEEPDNVKAILGLDYLGDRGPVIRYELEYLRDQYEGYSRGFLIDDHGQDQLSRNREDLQPPSELRGRVLWRHRQYLPRDWEMQLELSYISDINWLEQFEEEEFNTDKDQETAIYLKKQRENWAFSLLANARLMDFISLTEHYPEARLVLIGEPIAELFSGFLDARAGVVRLRANNTFGPPAPLESSSVLRADVRAELDLPLQLGLLKVVPYASARGTTWDDSPTTGGEQRYFATAGVRVGTQFWRLYDNVYSRLLDLRRLRHIVQPQVHVFATDSNMSHGDLGVRLWPFDQDVEGLRDFGAVSIALLQTLQTKRGPLDDLRTVDWMSLDVRATFFNRQSPLWGTADFSDSAWATNMARMVARGRWVDYRPEYSYPRDNIQADLSLRLSDTTLLFADATYDMYNRGMDRVNVGLAVTRSPRLSYFVSDRYDSPIDMQVFTAGATYKLNEKYTVAGAQQIDIDNGDPLSTSMSLVRKFPRWYMALTVDLDRGRGNDAIMLTIWPEGAPEARIGSRSVGSISGGR